MARAECNLTTTPSTPPFPPSTPPVCLWNKQKPLVNKAELGTHVNKRIGWKHPKEHRFCF